MNTLLKRKHDLYSDLEKIKAGLTDTSLGIRHLIGDSYTHSIENLKQTSTNYKEDVSNLIAENPFKSIGACVLTGMVLGFLFKRR